MDETTKFYEIYELNPEEYENMDIDSANFSIRVNNRLHRGEISTVGALLNCTPRFLSSLSGFGAGCFKEIHQFCEELAKKNKRVSEQETKKRTISANIYEHKNLIINGDFSFEPTDEEERVLLLEYKLAYDCLGDELVSECIENPNYVFMISKVLAQFSNTTMKMNEYLKDIPSERKTKKAKYFVGACTYSLHGKEELIAKLNSDDESLESFLRRNAADELIEGSPIALLAKDCTYDLYALAEAFFNEIRKNERAYEIVKLRAEGQTLEQVGCEFTVTRERVRQIEKKVSTKFINWLKRYSILEKMVAEQNGEEVLYTSCFECYFREFAIIVLHFLKVYEDEIDNFIYDKGLNVFVYGNEEVIVAVQEYVEELPVQFNERELEDILHEGYVTYGYPIELINRAIEVDYNKTGDVYHRSRLTLGRVYADVLQKHYQQGIWIYSDSELEGFRKHIKEEYGDIKLPDNNRAFVARIAAVGILCGRGTYGPKKEQYISNELAEKIHAYIVDSESPIFLTNTIYNIFEEELVLEGITNKYYLQGIMRELYADEFVFRRDYVSKDGNLTSVYSEIVGFIERAAYPVTKQQIVDAFPGVTEIVINISISDPDVLNLFGVYIHSNKLQFEKTDIEYLKRSITQLTNTTEVFHIKNLFEYIQRDNPTLLTNSGIYQAFGLFSVIEYLFRDVMEFSRPYIGKKGATITRTFDQLHEMVEESDVIALADVISVARENHFQINSILEFANSCNETHLLINDKDLAAIEYTGVDDMLALEIEESIVNEISGTMYISDLSCVRNFSKINVPWTNWLIYSIVLKWSSRLDVAATSTTFRQAQPVVSLRGNLDLTDIESRENLSDVYVPDDLDNIDELISDIILDEIEV